MEWSSDIAQMDWWTAQLRPFADYCVGSIIPAGFEAVGRLFHPIELDGGGTETWASLARRNARTAHADMQLHAIATPLDLPVEHARPSSPYCWIGDLPPTDAVALSDVLAHHTATADTCWFGVWEGYGDLPLPPTIAEVGPGGPRNRRHYLLRGGLADIDAGRSPTRQVPNLWWPDDRAWFVATEIDFCWTLVAGSAALIAELETTAGLEVLATGYDANHTVHGDPINT